MLNAPPPAAAIELRDLGKTFRGFWGGAGVRALGGLTLEVAAGEILGLLGPNGSGKSTTIKLILGLLRPTRGTVRVLGGPPDDVGRKARIGYLPEESCFHAHLTGTELLDFYGRLFRLPAAVRARRGAELVRQVGLEAARDRPVGEYSKGMLRRIGLAQALINDPELVILDEPTAGMDPLGTREVKDLLLDLKRRGKTVLLSSHLLADVEDVCDRVAILHQGELRALGRLETLLADDRRTQIVTGPLSPQAVEDVLRTIRQHAGADAEVHVGHPTSRLEELFIRTVTRGPPEP